MILNIHSLYFFQNKSSLNEQEQEKSELPAASMKLIHSGKVLKDTQTVADCQLKPNAFLVVMLSKVSHEKSLSYRRLNRYRTVLYCYRFILEKENKSGWNIQHSTCNAILIVCHPFCIFF